MYQSILKGSSMCHLSMIRMTLVHMNQMKMQLIETSAQCNRRHENYCDFNHQVAL